jgi:hypothetical protein
MDLLEALAIIAAYKNQGKLSGAQRRLLMTAQETVFKCAETIRVRAER